MSGTDQNLKKEAKDINMVDNQHMEKVSLEGEAFFKIANSDGMRPFFMSIVSDSNHWMFISSNGGLTAGRKNAQYALFPYYTDDKITESVETTGSKTIFNVGRDVDSLVWEPFSFRDGDKYTITRNLYKGIFGNKIRFEEVNHDLGLTFYYQWSSSNAYGFVRESGLVNNSGQEVEVDILDGIQNIIPYGVGSELQNRSSNLVDAYKRSELIEESGLAIYALSAIIVDRAEPSEALKANTVWSTGLGNPRYLLSSLQLNAFRRGGSVHQETDVKAEKGAYFLNKKVVLPPLGKQEWAMVANVNQDHSAIAALSEAIKADKGLFLKVKKNVGEGTTHLISLVAASDGLQLTSDGLRDTRHFANTLFNIMRGGIFDDNYRMERADFIAYLSKANTAIFPLSLDLSEKLSDTFPLSRLRKLIQESGNKDLERLGREYMPLKFSRRHGDPSRPWNVFSINTRSEVDGSKILDYQGNWRDIFQNWEALVHAYPGFVENMIFKFLNASTFDGYNPYRVTKDGFDWEILEPDDPWAYIGYWGDHQLIYLLKFLEFSEKHFPGRLSTYFNSNMFVYANVPYRIREYGALLCNPKDTIEFDVELDDRIRGERERLGADAALLCDQGGATHKVNFIEKILASVLAKLANFIPEGGIWMNTQRPEWNDANNALVGNGSSMVTLYYLRRFLRFFGEMLHTSDQKSFELSKELSDFFGAVLGTFSTNRGLLGNRINDVDRKRVLDGLGKAASKYRSRIYQHSFSGKRETLNIDDIKAWVDMALEFLHHSIAANKREDGLYHAYNLMTVESETEVSVSYLSEMLEGQVAVLSSGYLSAEESLGVLDALKSSALFREDQYSYILYPNKDLPKFQEKNTIPDVLVRSSDILKELLEKGHGQIVKKDVKGAVHFNGSFRNAADLEKALEEISINGNAISKDQITSVLQAFETVFDHKAFTGRSGTFFGYEGLGSIYWHMVSKLLLAVQECCLSAIEDGESEAVIGRLLEHYYEINEGIGVHKPPSLYGAFPTDPYSHTPAGKGAQQPGMTGQVKEDVLSRFGELGVYVKDGRLGFKPNLLRGTEFLTEPGVFAYVTVGGEGKSVQLQEKTLAFTYCQVPVIYKKGIEEALEVHYVNGTLQKFGTTALDIKTSEKIFGRTGEIEHLICTVSESRLR